MRCFSQIIHPVFLKAMALAVYMVVVELLFCFSNPGVLPSLPLENRPLIVANFFLGMATFIMTLGVVLNLMATMVRSKKMDFFVTLVVSLLFSFFVSFHANRWIYSAFGLHIAYLPVPLAILISCVIILLGVLIAHRTYKPQSTVPRKLVVFASVMTGATFILYAITSVILYPQAPNLGEKKDVEVLSNVGHSGQKDVSSKPNIIFITFDGVDFCHTVFAGYQRATTPWLSGHANEFFIFSHAIAVAGQTRAGFVSNLMGLPPLSTGIYGYGQRLSDFEENQSLPYILRQNGYFTEHNGELRHAEPRRANMGSGFTRTGCHSTDCARLFDVDLPAWLVPVKPLIEAVVGPYLLFIESGLGRPERFKLRIELALADWNNQFTTRTLVALRNTLDQQGSAPVFFVAHLLTTHEPIKWRSHNTFSNLPKRCDSKCLVKASDTPHDLYDDSLLGMDEIISQIVRLVDESAKRDNTVIVFSTDHQRDKKTTGTPVLFLVKIPGKMGKIIDQPVWLLDIAPTLLEFAGLKILSSMSGVSLKPLMDGHDRKIERDSPIHVESFEPRDAFWRDVSLFNFPYRLTLERETRQLTIEKYTTSDFCVEPTVIDFDEGNVIHTDLRSRLNRLTSSARRK